MIKKTFGLTLLMGIALLSSACVVVSLGGGNNAAINIQGTGAMVSRTFDTEAFHVINIGSSFVVTYSHSNTPSLVIEMQENLFEYLEVFVEDGTLNVGPRGVLDRGSGRQAHNFNTSDNNRPRIYIYAPYLSAANLFGDITGGEWDTIYRQNFNVSVAGAVDLTIPLEVELLEINIAGAGNLELNGNADVVNITVAGAGDISAFDLQARDVNISVAGAGNVDVSVLDNLDATVSGVGRVRYMGNPTVNRQVVGIGSVERY